jgi:hypothetical protein
MSTTPPPPPPPTGPSAPPPGPGGGYIPPPGAQAPPPPGGNSRRNWTIGLSIGAVLLVIAIIAAVLAFSSDDAEAGEVFLDPTSDVGRDPFTDSVAGPDIEPIAAGSTPATSAGGPVEVRSRPGSEPGLYGGTQNQAQCDRRQLIDFLAANPDKAAAWAGVQGIGTNQVEDYILDLTSMQLRVDTRVTNHGFRNGRATTYQTVLQAGTAVLVDIRGIPRARCACGNPLTPPVAISTRPTYTGTRWSGFSQTNIQVVVVQQTVNVFILTDVDTGEDFERPVGTDGEDDQPVGGEPPDTTVPDTVPPTTSAPAPPQDFGGANDVQIDLTWTGDDDLDIHVIDPNGEELFFGSPTTSTGGVLEGGDDVPGCGDTGSHDERAFWPAGSAPSGGYQVWVEDFGACDDDGASFSYQITVGGQVLGGDSGFLTPGDQSATQSFSVS